nr:immunoglobulin heavy chain junction region [Homo sapiens]
GRFTISRDDSK